MHDSYSLVPLEGEGTRLEVTDTTARELLFNSTFLSNYCYRVRQTVDDLAYRLFGFPRMRDFQHRIFSHVLRGRHILGIAATGGGKSECFILPAMLLPGITIVIVPLKSLMADQFEQRIQRRYGLNHLTTYINGDICFREQQARLRRIELGYYKLVYFTPEQLERGWVLDSLRRANQAVGIRYLAMDEAHCISQWGHDFRPAYLNISLRLRDYGIEPIFIALTATASPEVRQDICNELNLDQRPLDVGGDVFIDSSNRPELNLIVRVMPTTRDKSEAIVQDLQALLQEQSGAAIVFMPWTGGDPDKVDLAQKGPLVGKNSARVVHFAAYLEKELQRRVCIYHGKMDNDEPQEPSTQQNTIPLGNMQGRTRQGEQNAFIDSEQAIMIATKGFGMGIDKSNIRLVIHRTPPTNLEAYAQEAGRAGRDGQPANAILYYSSDCPIDDSNDSVGQSDHDIQKFFLSGKYIRREDVVLMRAFLKTLSPRSRYLYFTNDDAALPFFEGCTRKPSIAGLTQPYSWPEKVSSRREKTDYLHRILQVIYRIRPDVTEQLRCTFLEQVYEAGTHLQSPKVLNAQAILTSNAYFGQMLRNAGMQEQELSELLQAGDFFPIANRLQLSLHETASLLTDIRAAENLLYFKRIVAPRRDGKGYGRGWEVLPGTAFYDDEHFSEYLAAFIDLHDSRKENDWASYRRMVTGYIGVNENGSVEPWQRPRECLRAILLGYLETYEVVDGNNCMGCNHCVPDERFDRYSLEQRREVVVPIGSKASELLRTIKDKYVTTLPSQTLTNELFDVVREEELRGRQLIRYLEGWSGRLLQDTPDHRAALCIRLQAMVNRLFDLQLQEFVRNAEQLSRLASSSDETQAMWQLLTAADEVVPDEPRIYRIRADLSRSLGLVQEEEKTLISLVELIQNSQTNNPELTTLYARLCELYAPSGLLANPKQYAKFLRLLARFSVDASTAMNNYVQLVINWDWKQVIAEAENCKSKNCDSATVGLLCAWALTVDDTRRQVRTAQIVSHIATEGWLLIEKVTDADVQLLISSLGISLVTRQPKLAARLVELHCSGRKVVQDLQPFLELAFSAIEAGEQLSDTALQSVAQTLLRLRVENKSQETTRLPNKLAVLANYFQPQTADEVGQWLTLFPLELYLTAPPEVNLHSLKVTSHVSATLSSLALDSLEGITFSLLRNNALTPSVHESWMRIARKHPDRLARYAKECLALQPPKPEWAELTLDCLFENGNREHLSDYLRSIQFQKQQNIPIRIVFAAEFFQVIHKYVQKHGNRLLRFPLKEDFNFLRQIINPQQSVERADMLAATINTLRHSLRLTPTWLTPIALEVEALCNAHRYRQAAELERDYPGLQIGREKESLNQVLSRVQQSHTDRSADSHYHDYQKILKKVYIEILMRDRVKLSKT